MIGVDGGNFSPSFDLRGRVAAVTGANTGLGRAIAEALAGAGADVALIGRSDPEETLGSIHAMKRRAIWVNADLGAKPDYPGIVAEVSGKPIRFEAVSDEQLYAVFDSMGIPREPVDDLVVGGVPWCSDDMVSYERSIREGRFAVKTDSVLRLAGHAPQSVQDFARQRSAALAK